ncbi:MAG: glutathione peroxidase [Niastella sp. SCN 39-18]|nr:glutathione peroxidase [Sphingobacteriales bacterium]ODT53737.1 MAG: glutathione peroxidase [Niastella sp. SCN 39-18]OJW09377.1 MAG: glutathione peroxidase [Sphingobacteriales bacterium 39-19]
MKYNTNKIILAISVCLLSFTACHAQTHTQTPKAAATSIYQFQVPDLEGGIINFASFKGKKILVVNTASKCGFTPQYKDLEALYEKYKDKLVIIGFPANNFNEQEPGSNEEIKAFCTKNYGVSFPMAEKISVKGSDMAPIYQWLTQKEKNGVLNAQITWNFNKFLLDENGRLIAWFPSNVTPLSPEIVSKL